MCAKCGYELFSSRSKYAHSSPWPAFTETIHTDSVAKRPEHNRPGAIKVGGSSGAVGKGCWPGGPENRPPAFLLLPLSCRDLPSVYSMPLASAWGAATPNYWEILGPW